MTLTLATDRFVDLLGDLLITVDGEGPLASILLHTAQGYDGDEPGRMTLLVGTSTNRYLVGHTFTAATGAMDPMLWPADDARAVIAVFKPLSKHSGHTITISRQGDEIVVAEDPDLFGNGTSLRFTPANIDDWPRSLFEILTTARTDAPRPAPRLDLSGPVLKRLGQLALRFKEPLQTYRFETGGALLAQIGRWRGMILPVRWDLDEKPKAGKYPGGDVYAVTLPPVKPEPVGAGA